MEDLPKVNLVDILIIIIVFFAAIQGFRRGFTRELGRIISLVIAVLLGWKMFHPFGEFIAEQTELPRTVSFLLGFVVILLMGYLVMHLIRIIFRNMVEVSFKGGVENLGGLVLATAKIVIFITVLIFMISMIPHQRAQDIVLKESFTGRTLYRIVKPYRDTLSEAHPDLRFFPKGQDEPEEPKEEINEDEGQG